MRKRAVTGAAAVDSGLPPIPAFCFVTDAVGDFVYVMGDKVGDIFQVSKVDIDNPSKMPAMGVIISKSGPTDCIVQIGGIVYGLYAGLTPGRLVTAHTDARPIHSYVRPTVGGYRLIQVVGVAVSSTDILLGFEIPTAILPP